MAKTAYIFFENLERNWQRFPNYLHSCFDKEDFFFIYNIPSKKSNKSQILNSFKYSGNICDILTHIQNYSEVKVILMSYRPIDLIFFKHLKERSRANVIGIKIQHGIYSDKLERASIFDFIFSTRDRLITYIKTIYITDIFTIKEKVLLLIAIFKIYVQNKIKFSDSESINNLLDLPKNVFVFDNTWIKYFNTNYYKDKQPNYTFIPPKDLSLIKSGIIKKQSVVIIAQSLVEDGRYSKVNLRKELELILRYIPENLVIYLKRHPRSDNKLYQDLSRNLIITDNFIIADFIISGYSSLMQTYLTIGCNVFCWKFVNHHNPDIFNEYCTIYGREKELTKFFNLPKNILKITEFSEMQIEKIYADNIKAV